jgi:antitoxin HicB
MVQPLPLQEGGGFDATVPDLLGSMSEAKTPEEALTNVQDAVSRGLPRLVTGGGM